MTIYLHDPDETLDYTFTLNAVGGETITDHTTTPSPGLVVNTTTQGATAITVWLSTDGTIGRRTLACRITTTAGRVYEETAHIIVDQR